MTFRAHEQTERRRAIASRRTLMLAAMLAAFIGVGAITIWDAARASEATLIRMAERHRLLAFTLSKEMSSRLALMEATAPAHEQAGARERYLAQLLEDARELQHKGGILLLVRPPDRPGFLSADGRLLSSQTLEEALQRGAESVILHREEAVQLGLPRRRAVAGLGRVADREGLVPLAIAVVSTTKPERERSLHEEWRSTVSLALLALIVFTFGGATLREQQRESELTAQLERERVERERDAQLDRADRLATVAALSTGIAHELATPLGVITGRVEQLTTQLNQLGAAEPAPSTSPQGPDPRMLRAVRVIGEQVERMRAVMHGFLALARGESPRMEQTSPATLGRDAEELVRHRFAKCGARLVVQAAEDLPPIACDAPLFTQVLVNLLVNACQASRPGDEVRLVIDRSAPERTAEQAPGQAPGRDVDLVRFAVYDEGEGIASDIAHRVTQPFFTTRGATGGTGLGLAIASELVQHHQGQLIIEPRARREGPGQRGTVAEVYTPIAKEEADVRRQARP